MSKLVSACAAMLFSAALSRTIARTVGMS